MKPEAGKACDANALFGGFAVEAAASATDWNRHPMGPVSCWPGSLKTVLGILLHSRIPMFVAWGKERTFFYNDAYSVILGKKHPEAFGRGFQEIWPEIWPEIEPMVLSVENGMAVYQEDMRLLMNRYGFEEETYFTFSYSPIHGERGRVQGLYCAVVETTSRVKTERRLRESEEQVRALQRETERARLELYEFFMQSPAPLAVLLGPEHRFALANPPYEEFVGRKVVGKTVRQAFEKENVGFFLEKLQQVYQTGESYLGMDLPLELVDCDGNPVSRYIDVCYRPYRDGDGSIKGVLAYHQDVTEQVTLRRSLELLADDLKSAVRARDEFISVASHELKTPITSLKLQAQILSRKVNRELVLNQTDLQKFTGLTLRQLDQLTRLVEDMLDIVRITSGRLRYDFMTCNLKDVLKEAYGALAEQFFQAKIPLELEAEDATVSCDAFRVKQVIINLLTNAFKYGRSRPVKVSLVREGSHAVVRVLDQGEGIAPESHGCPVRSSA